MRLCMLVAASIIAVPAALAQSLTVVDGDTLRLDGERLRLLSIDAPETYEPRCRAERAHGERATARLEELIATARSVEIIDSGERDDCCDRPLVDLLIDGHDAGDILISEGLALPWRPGRAAWLERRRHWCGF